MKAKRICLGLTAAAVILCTGTFAYASGIRTEIFTGLNGEEVTVISHEFSQNDNAAINVEGSVDYEDVKLGDIIVENGTEEIVIAVSEDGRYVTMPLKDYQAENRN